ncbi:MAG: hypothetical protein RLZZ507_3883 [Cyanobacteriota bacterium]|jgi:hypothetical protein
MTVGGKHSVMFWEKDSIKYEIFNHYEYALSAVGVDFEQEDVQAALEGCSFWA